MLPATAPLYTHNQQAMHHNSHLHPHQQQNHQQAHMQTPQGPPIYPYQQPFPPQPLTPQQMQQQQFAQWAYQNMMFNAHQQHQLAAFQLNGPMAQSAAFDPRFQQQQQMQLAQMHQQQLAALQHQQQHQQQQHHFPQPPYARESNGSRSSLNSSNGSSRSQDAVPGRRRTPSNRSNTTPIAHTSPYPPGTRIVGAALNQGRSSPGPLAHQRVSSTSSHGSSTSSSSPAATALAAVAARSQSQTPPSSGPSSLSGSPNSFSPTGGSKAGSPRGPPKPSPLSQGSSPLSRVQDDGDLTDTPTPMMIKSGGLKGRLRRALSFSAVNSLESTPENGEEKLGSRRKVVAAKLTSEGQTPIRSQTQPRPSTDSASTLRHGSSGPSETPNQVMPTEPSIRSINTNGKKKGRSLFNARFNASTDNISLSSTVSSASVMIRKLGSVGQLARRNSLMKISNLFKDKEKKRAEAEAATANSDGEATTSKGKAAGKSKKGVKSDKSEASVTHATVELERGANGGMGDDMTGLSPAAKLARQHTLKSKAQEAARVRTEKEQKEKDVQDGKTPTTWEKNTATRASGKNLLHSRKSSSQNHGSDDDALEASDDDGTYDGQHGSSTQQPPSLGYSRQAEQGDSGSDNDQEYGNDYDDEDPTVTLDHSADLDEPWAVGIRRSVERMRTPCKGILKHAGSYDQSSYLNDPPQAPFARTRSNSYDSAPPNGTEPGPLARIPSPDPDHIDGLHHRSSSSDHHRSGSTSSAKPSFLPPLKFDDGSTSPLASALTFDDSSPATPKERSKRDSAGSGTFSYQQPSFNASAPALATSLSAASNKRPSNVATRSATAPLALNSRKLTFAANLSVYHTFSPTVYDRRSEPATCNRLTPALAQRIKEELNNYKMEEMEVHHMSRAHTHFFV